MAFSCGAISAAAGLLGEAGAGTLASAWRCLCIIILCLRCLWEALVSIFRHPFVRHDAARDVPVVVHAPTEFNTRVVAACPSLLLFRPLWWADGGHVQTLAMSLKRLPRDAPPYRREALTLPCRVSVTLSYRAAADTPPDAPLVLCLHGMGGCDTSEMMELFTAAVAARGQRAVVYNRRGHGGNSLLPRPPSEDGGGVGGGGGDGGDGAGAGTGAGAGAGAGGTTNDAPPPGARGAAAGEGRASGAVTAAEGRAPAAEAGGGGAGAREAAAVAEAAAADASSAGAANGGDTAAAAATAGSGAGSAPRPKIFPKHVDLGDMLAAVEHVCAQYPDAPKFLIGFSCGANLCISYLAHAGASSPFIAAASVSNGYDIMHGTSCLRSDPVLDTLSAGMLREGVLKRKGRLAEVIHLAKAAGITIDTAAVMRATTLHELEELLVVPAYGFSSLREYYDGDSCHRVIGNVATPLLCIATRDDPFDRGNAPSVPIAAAACNEHIVAVVTRQGGHVGWVSNMRAESEQWGITVPYHNPNV
ncbi:hypothetical protein FOA52_015957 [Chlamydomonas sp. UWO 241]|nr:hypothetical protein FOA52_015957 [Chlamydomonas sp. UWO 241]